jgi:hypothetical protein
MLANCRDTSLEITSIAVICQMHLEKGRDKSAFCVLGTSPRKICPHVRSMDVGVQEPLRSQSQIEQAAITRYSAWKKEDGSSMSLGYIV